MQLYIPYRSSMIEITQFLKSHLYTYAPAVNVTECARAVVHDYFSSKFVSPFPCIRLNGCNAYINDNAQLSLGLEQQQFIASVINSSFWVASRAFSYMLNHCGHSSFQSVPTDCYFTIDRNEDMMVYVPLHNSVPEQYKQMAVPALALAFATKGGTENE